MVSSRRQRDRLLARRVGNRQVSPAGLKLPRNQSGSQRHRGADTLRARTLHRRTVAWDIHLFGRRIRRQRLRAQRGRDGSCDTHVSVVELPWSLQHCGVGLGARVLPKEVDCQRVPL